MKRNRPVAERFNPNLQVLKMRECYPQFSSTGRNGRYEFTGSLQPRPSSVEYLIRIKYIQFLCPKVFVLRPEIHQNAPHRYPSDNSLCLYEPASFTWTDRRFIADFIVPWTAAWLYFYEIWVETGIWYGPEASHDGIKEMLPK